MLADYIFLPIFLYPVPLPFVMHLESLADPVTSSFSSEYPSSSVSVVYQLEWNSLALTTQTGIQILKKNLNPFYSFENNNNQNTTTTDYSLQCWRWECIRHRSTLPVTLSKSAWPDLLCFFFFGPSTTRSSSATSSKVITVPSPFKFLLFEFPPLPLVLSFPALLLLPDPVIALILPSLPPVVIVVPSLSCPSPCFAFTDAKILSISSRFFICCSLATFSRSTLDPPAKVVLRAIFLPADAGSLSA